MLYALNLFNIKNGKQAQYQRYLREASGPLEIVGGSVIAGGRNPAASIGDWTLFDPWDVNSLMASS
jgi:hypothetical protein